jgi:predicted Fe-Mo cluster-binding NifX family protein
MRTIVCSSGRDLDADMSDVFGRSEYYLIVDTSDLSFETKENPARDESSGAGIKAAQAVLNWGAEAIIACNIGPKAFQVMAAGELKCYRCCNGSVRDALESLGRGDLEEFSSPNVDAHTGSSSAVSDRKRQGSSGELMELSRRLEDLRNQVQEIVREIESLTEEDR